MIYLRNSKVCDLESDVIVTPWVIETKVLSKYLRFILELIIEYHLCNASFVKLRLIVFGLLSKPTA